MFLTIVVANEIVDTMGALDDQTEKACLINGAWFPKSQIKFDGDKCQIPKWLWDQKKSDMGIDYDPFFDNVMKDFLSRMEDDEQ